MSNGATKVCTSCGLELPLDQFNRNPTGGLGRDARCRQCKSIRSRPTPEPPDVPDGRPARVLHLELRQSRERGEPFELAWPKARVTVLGIDRSWSRALQWSQPEWRACYERRGRPRVDPAALDDPAA
jgi:hypothetical protein